MNVLSQKTRNLVDSFYLTAISHLERGDGGWQYLSAAVIDPAVLGRNGEVGYRACLRGVTPATGPESAAHAVCPFCGGVATLAMTAFSTNVGGGGPIVTYRAAVSVCDCCQRVAVLAESVERQGEWRPVPVGFAPARPDSHE